MATKLRVIPASYVVKQKQFHTRGTRNPKTGQMTGRETTKNEGDRTGVIRVKKYFDRNDNGKRDSKDVYPGQIVGRTEVYVKGSKNQRAYMRR